MGWKSFLASQLASRIHSQKVNQSKNAVEIQRQLMFRLLGKAKNTSFGKDHNLTDVTSYSEFKSSVSLVGYEGLKPYIDKIIEGQQNVLWPGTPIYFASTAGTTSGSKYIPITKESMPYHIRAARNVLLLHAYNTKNSSVFDGKMIFLSGNPDLQKTGEIPSGRLSGIVNHHVPSYVKGNQLPSKSTNRIDDWEKKLELIVDETIGQRMTLISGIPPWVQMYFDKLQSRTGKKIIEIFPDLQVVLHGGVNFKPYESGLKKSLGGDIEMLETYPASEGFIAFQDYSQKQQVEQNIEGLLLVCSGGIFYEFVPLEEINQDNPTRVMLGDIELGKNYAMILNTNAGLWGYILGDTVEFVSKDPYRIKVTGRIEHFISAFGEHVIVSEVEDVLMSAAEKHKVQVVEFTVAPKVEAENELPFHEWFIEIANPADGMESFAGEIDTMLCKRNKYYEDLVIGKVLQPLKITLIKKDGFRSYMESIGKLGGQNKLPRLANNREIADELIKWKL